MDSHSHDHGANGNHGSHGNAPRTFVVRVLRQDAPGQLSYWERRRIEYEPDMNVTSVLQRIAAQGEREDGSASSPVAYESNCLEEVCGSCTMLINGKVRQACSALVDNLLADGATEIELRPMAKFPVLRDLLVDRQRMFHALQRIKGWIPVDGYFDLGPGPRQSQEEQQQAYPLSECMTCGCCLDACPQYLKVELTKRPGESEEAFALRKREAHNTGFVGAAAISQAMLFNSHPTGKMNASERVEALMDEGGIQACGNSQNCVAVCPKSIPLTTSIGRAGRAATFHWIKQLFDK